MIPVVLETGDVGWSMAVPLWLPYVIFTVVLLSLIVVSFARFSTTQARRSSPVRRRSSVLEWDDKPRRPNSTGAWFPRSILVVVVV